MEDVERGNCFGVQVANPEAHAPYLTIQECVDKQLATTTHHGWWKCPICEWEHMPLKVQQVIQTPLVLMVQLLRWHSEYDEVGILRTELSPHEIFPSKELRYGGTLYILQGVVIHVGMTSNAGHYTAWVRARTQPEQWRKYDDSRVTVHDRYSCDIGRGEKTYLAFYERRG